VPFGAGYPEYELKEGGSEIAVDRHNVGEYIKAVVDATLHTGIKEQMQAFRRAPPLSAVHVCEAWLSADMPRDHVTHALHNGLLVRKRLGFSL